MAEPISKINRKELSEEEKRKKDLEEIEHALLENKEAILQSMTLMKNMQDRGVIEMASALFGQGDKVMHTLIETLDKPESTNAIKNGLLLMGTIGLINVRQLEPLLIRLDSGIAKVAEAEDSEDKTSIFDLLKALRDPEINRSITLLMSFLKGMGENTSKLSEEMQPDEELEQTEGKTRN